MVLIDILLNLTKEYSPVYAVLSNLFPDLLHEALSLMKKQIIAVLSADDESRKVTVLPQAPCMFLRT